MTTTDFVHTNDIVEIDYTNWKGERTKRRIKPQLIYFGWNDWHNGATQWFLLALDVDKHAERHFAMANIHSWKAADDC